ncbi:MAG: serine/threonine-protein phosphatase [Treponema sp.]|nr:serine/threonine-protein phosphatase [Treponema sp.]
MIYALILSAVSIILLVLSFSAARVLHRTSYAVLIGNIFLLAIATGIMATIVCFEKNMPMHLNQLLSRIVIVCEGCFWINVSYNFLTLEDKNVPPLTVAIRFFLYGVMVVAVFSRFTTVLISRTQGIVIESSVALTINDRQLPLDVIIVLVLQVILPALTGITMLIRNRIGKNLLVQQKGYARVASLVLLWALLAFNRAGAVAVPQLSLLFIVPGAVFCICAFSAVRIDTVLSPYEIAQQTLKILFTYIIPSGLAGALYYIIATSAPSEWQLLVLPATALCFALASFVSWGSARFLTWFNVVRSDDYVQAFEKDLSNIDYSLGTMDDVITQMIDACKKHCDVSSVAVFINNKKNTLTVAYSSHNLPVTEILPSPLFDFLLNENIRVLTPRDCDAHYELEPIRGALSNLFAELSADVLFILAEGRTLHGIIALGKRMNTYKPYDVHALRQLYSYFFVFGYYLRNISNRKVVGTVNREIQLSSQIIASLEKTREFPLNKKAETGCFLLPAHNIGGEFIDCIRLTNTHHLFVIGDLSGSGIAASMSMVILKSIIRTFLSETNDFKELVVKINSFVHADLQKGTIFSGIFLFIDFSTDTLYYINCSIPSLILYTHSYNDVIEIQGSGHVLGFVPDITPYIAVKKIALHAGDVLLACTKGLVNSCSLRGEAFGKERVQQTLRAHITFPADRIAQFEYDALVAFMSKKITDDISVFVLKYHDAEGN